MDQKKNSEIAKAAFFRKKLDKPTRDVFICVGEKCCSHLSDSEKESLWEYLKTITRDNPQVNRFSTKCLRVCASGPIVKSYPDGSWYHSMEKDKLNLLVDGDESSLQKLESHKIF